MSQTSVFITIDDVLFIHNDQITNYGGDSAIRDLSLLESAIAQFTATVTRPTGSAKFEARLVISKRKAN